VQECIGANSTCTSYNANIWSAENPNVQKSNPTVALSHQIQTQA